MIVRCAHDALVPVAEIKENPKNPNKHPKEQIETLAKIMAYQGVRQPVVVSNRSGLLTKGHGRLAAARSLGWEKIPVNYQDYDDEAQEFSDMVADNEIARWAKSDLAQINYELPNLGPDFDLDVLGIQHFVLDPSELPEEPKELDKSKLGETEHSLIVVCKDEQVQKDLFEELSYREELECKIL